MLHFAGCVFVSGSFHERGVGARPAGQRGTAAPCPVSVCLDPAGQEHVFASVGCVCLCSLDQGEQCLSLTQSPAVPAKDPQEQGWGAVLHRCSSLSLKVVDVLETGFSNRIE